MKLTIVYKLGIGAVLLVLISSGMVGALFYNKTTHLLVEQSAEYIADEIRNAGLRFQAKINTQKKDTQFLASAPPIQGILRALKTNNYDNLDKTSYLQWQLRLQSIFRNMLISKPEYLQIRFIDKHGLENVNVKYSRDKIEVLTNKSLQNKYHRTYFQKTLKLPKDSIYLSEINLNREHGKISIPHQKVLRSAVPIYDEQNGEFSGILIVTADMSQAFEVIQSHVESNNSNVYITNDKGGYLLHPEKRKNFGFDLGKQYRIQEDFPKLSVMYLPENKSSEVTQLPKSSDDKYLLNFTKIPFDPSQPERFIAVGITELYSVILNRQKEVLTNIVLISAALALGFVFLAIGFAYRISSPIKRMTKIMEDYTHNRQTTETIPTDQGDEIGVLAHSYNNLIHQIEDGQKNLKQLNENLGKMVAERTLKLESSENYQRAIVESMADGLITSDTHGLILSFNTAAESIFGYNKKEIIGKNLSTLMPPKIGSEHNRYLIKYHKTGVKHFLNTHRETEGQRKDGSTFPIDLAISEIVSNDQHIFSGVVRDITDRKQMEKMKNEFISTVSHELRTPLTAIRGSLGLINGGVTGEIPEKAADLLQLADNNTNRLLLLINDILDIQKMESGELSFNFMSIDVMPFLKQVIEDNSAYGEQYNVKYKVTNPPADNNDLCVIADKHRIMQVLANLLSNATKFSPKNGTVEISTKRNTDGKIEISVTDHGEGIPKDFQSRLFDKFTQSDSTTTRRTGGTGLGLNISKTIMEKHGGRIEFISTEGTGTTFTIIFPKPSNFNN